MAHDIDTTDAIWEKRDDESIAAYAAFCKYRDLRSDRSLPNAFAVDQAARGKAKPKRASGTWIMWSSKYDWTKRSQAYDAYVEKKLRAEKEKAYCDEVRQFRERQKALATASLAASSLLLEKAIARLRTFKQEDIRPGMVTSMLRASAAISEAATNAGAQAMAIEELLRALDNQ